MSQRNATLWSTEDPMTTEPRRLFRAVTRPTQGPRRVRVPHRRLRRVGLATASVVVTLGVLQIAGVTGLLSRESFPLVSEVLVRLGEESTDQRTWTSIWRTLSQALTGLGLGGGLAIVAGLALGRAPLAERSVRPIIEFLRPIPSVAILPLVILTVGVGFEGAIVLTSISSFWMVLVMTLRGAQAVDPVAEQTLVTFRVPRWTWTWNIVFPSALPFIVTGVRIAASVSLVVAVTVEMLGGMPGLGKDVQIALQNADTVGLYSLMFITGLLGLAINVSLKPVERRLLSWHPSQRGGVS